MQQRTQVPLRSAQPTAAAQRNRQKFPTMTIIFVESVADADKGFRLGNKQSLFVNNVTFKVTGYKLGHYNVAKDGSTPTPTKYANTCQSIMLTTDLGSDEDLPLNRLLHKRRVCYDNNGRAVIVPSATFQSELLAFIEQIGRRRDDPSMIVGSAESVAKKVLEFFGDKTIHCHERDYLLRDKDNKLVAPLSPIIQFSFE